MRRVFAATVLAFMLGSIGAALAGSIKSWSNGEILGSDDLNSNFSHIHGTMVGGHGARLVNADVASNAAIAHTKLATPALLPKAWAYVGSSACTTGTCAQAASAGAAMTITWTGSGAYTVTWGTARSNANYAVFLSAHTVTASVPPSCYATGLGTTQFLMTCYDHDDADPPDATDMSFSILVMDNDS